MTQPQKTGMTIETYSKYAGRLALSIVLIGLAIKGFFC